MTGRSARTAHDRATDEAAARPARGGRLGGTKRGVGDDPRAPLARPRPPARVRPGDRAVGVGLVLRDPIERTTLAKALIHGRCSVVTIDSLRDAAIVDLDALEVVVADFDLPEVITILDALRVRSPELPAIAWTGRKAVVERGLEAMGFESYEVVERTTRAAVVVELVRRLAGA